jgi:hypothetical protein
MMGFITRAAFWSHTIEVRPANIKLYAFSNFSRVEGDVDVDIDVELVPWHLDVIVDSRSSYRLAMSIWSYRPSLGIVIYRVDPWVINSLLPRCPLAMPRGGVIYLVSSIRNPILIALLQA